MTRVAIVGYGNIGRFAQDAVQTAPDMELAGIVRRKAPEKEICTVKAVESVDELGRIDVALLCVPTRSVEEIAPAYLAKGITTVDCFGMQSKIVSLREKFDALAKAGGCRAVIAAGLDPGGNSAARALMQACAPKGITYTNYGPGMSIGHSVAVKGKKGVIDALSMTIPAGAGVHRRMVYVQLEPSAKLKNVIADIKADPYFINDDTKVMAVENVSDLIDMGHSINTVRKGVSGKSDNQFLEFNMEINNPALTAQLMVGCARAALKQPPGAYTILELPPVDLLHGRREEWIGKLMWPLLPTLPRRCALRYCASGTAIKTDRLERE